MKPTVFTPERQVGLALLGFCALLYIPLAGRYGLWDPWETHYGEIARQMVARNDWVSLWWPGSPIDRVEVFHKPVLHFWLLALSYKLFGFERSGAAPDELVASWGIEWATRLPNILLSIAAIIAVWQLVRRLVGLRAAVLAALVLATSSQWVFITRQAVTDLPFVAPMTLGLALSALAMLLPENDRERPLPRRALGLGSITISFPHARAFYGFVALFVLTTVPQLVVISLQLHVVVRLHASQLRFAGVVPMLPYIVAWLAALVLCARAKNRRQLYLFSAYVLCGLASLAKGPAGLGLPALVLFFYVILSGRWRELFTRLELPRGVLIFVAVAFPWYHAMLIRHGLPFWNELIGDNYVHRAQGRNGDRGTFEYYLTWLGYGTFPWSGIVAYATTSSFGRLRERHGTPGPREGLIGFALVWCAVELSVMTLVNTKFHHYILPVLPSLAILSGILLDDLLSATGGPQLMGLLLVATPVTLLCGRDLAALPARLLWLCSYDYVVAPGAGRPWPLPSVYGDRYQYGDQIFAFAILATVLTALIGVLTATARSLPQPPSAESSRSRTPIAIVVGILLLGVGVCLGPGTHGEAPAVSRTAWLWPCVLVLPAAGWLAWLAPKRPRAGCAAIWSLLLVAVLWSGFLVDKLLIELSPHWSQKHVIAAYYAQRSGPAEPLVAWELYWRGENFYTRNELYRSPDPSERTVFLPQDRPVEKLTAYLAAHPDRRIFFLTERTKLESLRSILPLHMRSTLTVVDESNNKLFLAVAHN